MVWWQQLEVRVRLHSSAAQQREWEAIGSEWISDSLVIYIQGMFAQVVSKPSAWQDLKIYGDLFLDCVG